MHTFKYYIRISGCDKYFFSLKLIESSGKEAVYYRKKKAAGKRTITLAEKKSVKHTGESRHDDNQGDKNNRLLCPHDTADNEHIGQR